MNPIRIFVLCLIPLLAITGCTRSTAEQDQAPTIAPVSQEMREKLAKANPDAIIGRVIGVLPEDRLAAVGEIPEKQLNVGDWIGFYGSEGQIVAEGTVIVVLADSVHVRWNAPQAQGQGQRDPVAGDLAIRFAK